MKKQLEKVLKQYIKEFENKQDLTFEFAVDDNLMEVISFGSVYFFNMSDIIYDVDNAIKENIIIEWLEYTLQEKDYINYRTYLKMIL
mgnify:FL=1